MEWRREILLLLRAHPLSALSYRVGWSGEECTNHATVLPCPYQLPYLLSTVGNQNKKRHRFQPFLTFYVTHSDMQIEKRLAEWEMLIVLGFQEDPKPPSPTSQTCPVVLL